MLIPQVSISSPFNGCFSLVFRSVMNFSNLTDVGHGFRNSSSLTGSLDFLMLAVYKMILSPVTVISNGLLLLVGTVDPLRSFRNPSSLFLLTMSAANVLTGIIVAPIFAALEYNGFFGRKQSLVTAKVGSSFSLLSLNISFGMVFALAFDNFIAVFRPTKYRSWITLSRAKITILVISIIALTFAILPHLNVPIATVLKIDLHFNSTVNSVLLVVSYILLYAAFKNQTKKSLDLRARGPNKHGGKLYELRSKFRRVLFIFIVFSTVPAILSTIAYHLESYCDSCQKYKGIIIVQRVCLNLMFMKCALDPFAFGWRLARNRQALKKIICCQLHTVRQMATTENL